MPARANELYRQIVNADAPAEVLKEMVASKRTETEFLEFKGAGKIEPKHIKEFWSQALSGFANTEGGVLIWGIRAARIEHPDDSSRKIDAASELALVPHCGTFFQLLKDVLLEACVEPVAGVDLTEIDAGNGDGSGFVVCLIPEGKHKPYRAELDPKRQYYQRIGDSFVVIPHAILRSLFYPQLSANLRIRMTVALLPQHPGMEFYAYVSNFGQATARELFAVVETNRKMDFKKGPKFELSYRQEGYIATFEAFQSVHPGAELHLFSCSCSPDRTKSVEFSIALHSQHQPQQNARIVFSPQEFDGGTEKSADAEVR